MIQIRKFSNSFWYMVYDVTRNRGFGCELCNLQTTINNLSHTSWEVRQSHLDAQSIILATAPTFDDLRLSHPELFI